MADDPSASIDAAIARRVRYTLTPDDSIPAQRRHYLLRITSRAALTFYVVYLLGVAAFVFIAMPGASWLWILAMFGAVVFTGASYLVTMLLVFIPNGVRRLFRQQRSLQSEVEADWDEIQFRFTQQTAYIWIAWSDFFLWREGHDFILLYVSEGLFIVLPKRVLDAAQIADLRAIATRANVRGAG